MISESSLRKIREAVQKFWGRQVHADMFLKTALSREKEVGHGIADYVEGKTTELLQRSFKTKFETDRKGVPRPRSMGDIWIVTEGGANPVNVKSGVYAAGGQPNVVSLKKLLRGLLERRIDSYYVLVVKLEKRNGEWRPVVYLVDLLDYLDYVAYDSGPGQIMLKERTFYAAIDAATGVHKAVGERVEQLYQMLVEADERLAENRKKAREKFEVMMGAFREGKQPSELSRRAAALEVPEENGTISDGAGG